MCTIPQISVKMSRGRSRHTTIMQLGPEVGHSSFHNRAISKTISLVPTRDMWAIGIGAQTSSFWKIKVVKRRGKGNSSLQEAL